MNLLMEEFIEDYYHVLQMVKDEKNNAVTSDIFLLTGEYADKDLIDAFLRKE